MYSMTHVLKPMFPLTNPFATVRGREFLHGVHLDNPVDGEAIPTIQQDVDLTRMHDRKDDHDRRHQHRVKHVEEHFVRDEVSIVPLCVFDEAEDRPHQDEPAGHEESEEVDLPRAADLAVAEDLARGVLAHASVEGEGDDDEEAEEEDLHHQATDDQGLSRVERVLGFAGHDATAWLKRLL